ncbi:MAG: hypothetical protein IKG21_12845 [Atopobiaceae bacterium]|nr:hypothetical protein [Atopobiaceae bacterium]
MSKKKDVTRDDVELVALALRSMVLAPGAKKEIDVSRKESVALATGIAQGLVTGFEMARDPEFCREVIGKGALDKRRAVDVAQVMLDVALRELPARRDHLLALDENTPGVTVASMHRLA